MIGKKTIMIDDADGGVPCYKCAYFSSQDGYKCTASILWDDKNRFYGSKVDITDVPILKRMGVRGCLAGKVRRLPNE